MYAQRKLLPPVLAQKEMDEMLVKLVEHFDFDFIRAASSFARYGQFLATLHPSSEFFRIVDWKNDFNADICRCRYSFLQYKKGMRREEEEKVDSKEDISPSPTAKPLESFEEDLNDLEKPSNFSIFERSLKDEFEKLYDEVRGSLPTIQLDDINDTDSDKEGDIPEIFKSNLPPPTEFELKYFGDDFFVRSNPFGQTPAEQTHKPKRIFNIDGNMSTYRQQTSMQVRIESAVGIEEEEERWEQEFVSQVTIRERQGTNNIPVISPVPEQSTIGSCSEDTRIQINSQDSRYLRMQPYEHDSDVEDSEDDSNDE